MTSADDFGEARMLLAPAPPVGMVSGRDRLTGRVVGGLFRDMLIAVPLGARGSFSAARRIRRKARRNNYGVQTITFLANSLRQAGSAVCLRLI